MRILDALAKWCYLPWSRAHAALDQTAYGPATVLMLKEGKSAMVHCNGCEESRESVQPYIAVETGETVQYCDECGELALAGWNGSEYRRVVLIFRGLSFYARTDPTGLEATTPEGVWFLTDESGNAAPQEGATAVLGFYGPDSDTEEYISAWRADGAFPALDLMRDGISGVDLGIVGAWQYALTFVGNTAAAEVFRRRASDAGTYGGWRWECASVHPARASHILPDMAALANRIASAVEARNA